MGLKGGTIMNSIRNLAIRLILCCGALIGSGCAQIPNAGGKHALFNSSAPAAAAEEASPRAETDDPATPSARSGSPGCADAPGRADCPQEGRRKPALPQAFRQVVGVAVLVVGAVILGVGASRLVGSGLKRAFDRGWSR
jgi:hypothetical protein